MLNLFEANSKAWFWISLITPLYFGIISLHYLLTQPYIVQDDVRLHIVWLQRYIDPHLFPNDIIANYFPTLAPDGFKFIYWFAARFGVEPRSLASILPIALAIITTVYAFKLTLAIFPIPAAAFLSTVIVNQNLWLNDDLISATPRAFVYPFFAAFLYYLITRKTRLCLASMILMSFFYPQVLLVEIVVLTIRLINWQRGSFIRCSIHYSNDKKDYLIWLLGTLIALPLAIAFAAKKTEFEPLVTAAQMKFLPEFGWQGRNQYFDVSPFYFLFRGDSGFRFPLLPLIIWSSFKLPFLTKAQSAFGRLIRTEADVLLQVGLASLLMGLFAHLLLLKLYFPSRYTYPTIRFVMAIAAGIVVFIWLQHAKDWLSQKSQTKTAWKLKESFLVGVVVLAMLISIVVPAIPFVFLSLENWKVGSAAPLYEFLSAQPKDTLVASLAQEADNIPAFSSRSTLVGEEFAMAYHPKYFAPMKQRAIDLIQAHYSPNLTGVKTVIQTYGIDYFLIESTAFEPNYLSSRKWFMHSSFTPAVREAIASLQQGAMPALAKVTDCTALTVNSLILLDATCILEKSEQ